MTLHVVERFESMRYRRTLLEALAQLSCQLNAASEGLAAMQNIIRPSQSFSASLIQSLNLEITLYQEQLTEVLEKKLIALNSVLEKACVLFFKVAKLDDKVFIKNFNGGEKEKVIFLKLQEKLTLFQKQTHHCLAIRIILQERGVQIEHSKLMLNHQLLNQDLLAQELEMLRTREKDLRVHLRKEVVAMMQDAEQLLAVVDGHEVVQMMLLQNVGQLNRVLASIDSGGSLKMLPVLIEDIHCDLLPDGFFVDTHSSKVNEPVPELAKVTPVVSEPIVRDNNKTQQETLKENSFFVRARIWISTSWAVSWDDTKYYRHHR